MSSLKDIEANVRTKAGALLQVLDLAFGFFVWGAHFLTVYIATAVACVLGVGEASAGARITFLAALALVTVAAAALVLWHAVRRYRQGDATETGFHTSVTVGGDAIATVAISWQLFPILLVPPCG